MDANFCINNSWYSSMFLTVFKRRASNLKVHRIFMQIIFRRKNMPTNDSEVVVQIFQSTVYPQFQFSSSLFIPTSFSSNILRNDSIIRTVFEVSSLSLSRRIFLVTRIHVLMCSNRTINVSILPSMYPNIPRWSTTVVDSGLNLFLECSLLIWMECKGVLFRTNE